MNKRKLQNPLVLIAIIIFGFIPNQRANAQAASSYQFTALSGTYTNLTGGTPFASVQADDVCPAATIPLGFTFNFCGIDYTTIRAGSNGYLTFTTGGGQTLTNDISTFGTIKPALMWLWDDLDGASAGAASYTTTGTAPNRIFIFQYRNWEWNFGTNAATISCQIRLYESTNIIEYIYNQEAAAASNASASIGIVDGQATPTYLSLNNSSTNPTASSTTFTTNISTKPASGQIYRFKPVPPIDIKIDSVATSQNFCSNASVPISIAISNLGTATINNIVFDWSVDGVAQPQVSYTPPAPITNFATAPNNTAVVVLGDVFFSDNTPKVIKAWVVQANSLPDAVNTNDTVTKSKGPALTGVIVNIAPQDAVICGGTEITLDAGTHPKNPVYIWANGHISQTIQVSSAGSYSVKVQNTDGCFDYDTVNVSSYPNPEVSTIALVDNMNGSYTFNAVGAQNVTSYVWDFGDGQTTPGTGLPAPVNHSYVVAGDYTVTLTIRNNAECGDITVTEVMHANGIPTGINEMDKIKGAFTVYPNPSKSLVVVSGKDGVKIESVSLMNIVGQQVFRQDHVNAGSFQFNTTELAVGIYNIVIDADKGKVIKKLEVIR